MKTFILSLSMLFVPLLLWSGNSQEDAIKRVVQGAYIDGLQNLGDIQTIRQGFHPDFEMLLFRDGKMSKMAIEPWIQRVEQRKNDPSTKPPDIKGKFIDVEITGTVAVVKLELHREGSLIFTDYISLYKFPEGWKIVSKVYYQH